MSNPDPMNDPENERADDDLLRQEDDARRYEDEQAVRAEMEFKHDEKWLSDMRWTRLYNEAWQAWADGKPFSWPPTAEQLRR